MTKKKLHILSFYVTFDCDKYCRMCCMKAKKNGVNMAFATLGLTLKKLKPVVAENTSIGFSGGEPFLYEDAGKDIVDVLELFVANGYKRFDIQTAGWSRGDRKYEKRFARLKKFIPLCNMTINTSFNLYQKTGIEERLKNTLPLLLDSGFSPDVHMVIDFDNILQSFGNFYALANELNLTPDTSLNDVFSGIKRLDPEVVFQKIKFSGESGNLRLGASAMQRVGRGRTMVAKTVKTIGLCDYLKGRENSLVIYPDGQIKPCRVPQSINMASVGNIHTTSLGEIMSTRETLRDDILAHISGLPNSMSICDRCNQYKNCYTYEVSNNSRAYAA